MSQHLLQLLLLQFTTQHMKVHGEHDPRWHACDLQWTRLLKVDESFHAVSSAVVQTVVGISSRGLIHLVSCLTNLSCCKAK